MPDRRDHHLLARAATAFLLLCGTRRLRVVRDFPYSYVALLGRPSEGVTVVVLLEVGKILEPLYLRLAEVGWPHIGGGRRKISCVVLITVFVLGDAHSGARFSNLVPGLRKGVLRRGWIKRNALFVILMLITLHFIDARVSRLFNGGISLVGKLLFVVCGPFLFLKENLDRTRTCMNQVFTQ